MKYPPDMTLQLVMTFVQDDLTMYYCLMVFAMGDFGSVREERSSH